MQDRQSEQRLIPLFLRQILPKQLQKTRLTVVGWMLIIVAMGIGSAAYNTASNILFMTLSLILSSLILSGILSLINFRRLHWSLKVPEHLQVGELGMAAIHLENAKRTFPSMGLSFRVGSELESGIKRLYLGHAIPAGQRVPLDWSFVPKKRGRLTVELFGVESKFPFGFISKSIGDTITETSLVWPARAEYSFEPSVDGQRFQSGRSSRRSDGGSDLRNIRSYERGDPPRLIHWKATARMNHLMVRQLAQDSQDGFHLEVDPASGHWNPAQLETLCSVACALSEDLFQAGRLETVRAGRAEPIFVRGLRELHDFFDQLALLDLRERSGGEGQSSVQERNRIRFKPQGASGLSIYVNGAQAGQS